MKKFLVTCLALVLFAGMAMAQDFVPETLTLSAQENIMYAFDGNDLTIPVTLEGNGAEAMFLVFTKDMGASINNVQNGNLGWHYVHTIDTCIYYSENMQLVNGSNEIVWDGTDNDGNMVAEGEYTYYIWSFDNVSNRPVVCNVDGMTVYWESLVRIQEKDEAGMPIDKPFFFGSQSRFTQAEGDPTDRTNIKWTIGSDPSDASLLETSTVNVWSWNGRLSLQPDDFNYYYGATLDVNSTMRMRKYLWVPNGASEWQDDWGDGGEFTYSVASPPNWYYHAGAEGDGAGILYATNDDMSGAGDLSELIYVDINDGTELRRVDLGEWWVRPDDADRGGQLASGPSDLFFRNGMLLSGSHGSCMNTMMNPSADDDDDVTVWANGNGDFTGDHNFEEDADAPWLCHDYNVGPYKYVIVADDHLFSMFPSFDLGAVSFGLYAPDGTGLDYHAFAAESSTQKLSMMVCSYGSMYDGIYSGKASRGDITGEPGYFYTGSDTISGTISAEQIAVEEDAPAAFAVAQNSPNPFNPTTTISFSIAEAGQVNIDVFNVAGQKIDTIASEHLSAGNHTVTWDASGFSAGVYFYTVKTDGFSKTMKMTLLK